MDDRKGDVLEADKNRDSEKTVNFDITNISDILTSQQVYTCLTFSIKGSHDIAKQLSTVAYQ